MRRALALFAVLAGSAAALLVACGIDAVATFQGTTSSGDGATGEGGVNLPDALHPTDGGAEGGPNAAECAKRCPGTCDDSGTCILTCGSDGGACAPGQPVVCPAGLPCRVDCVGDKSCDKGVDCTKASRCTITCSGAESCQNDKVACSGSACVVDCSGDTACNTGVSCDAGTCDLGCSGDRSCQGAAVECFASTCTIGCGLDDAKNTCNRGVTCVAKDTCRIDCIDDDACQGGAVTATASEVSVRCMERNTCNQGVVISAGDGGVSCEGDDACGTGVRCDGGRCHARCDDVNNPINYCCAAGTCVPPTTTDCSFAPNSCL